MLYEYVDLWEKLEGVQLQPLVCDRFIWRWTLDGTYSASSVYRSFFLVMSSLLGAKELWKASALPKEEAWPPGLGGLRALLSGG